ncbi:MAG: thermonuclease family protein, partial [Acidobacteria bacterium]|nr:thermonuclease family protein [Acidobacteriota bacterium]
MNTSKLKLGFLAPILMFLALSVSGQSRFNGTVTQILDGKTIAIEPQPGVRITFELQSIEVPEPEQQLHATVIDHLSKLALNQSVSFDANSLSSQKLIGRVFLNGVDLSQQMIRDGAAWHVSGGRGGTLSSVEKIYQENEALAKTEKRGVWSVEDLKPAWEFRAEKAEKERLEELAKIKEIQAKAIAEQKPAVRRTNNLGNSGQKIGIETWFDGPNARAGNGTPVVGEYELLYSYNKFQDEGWVGTPRLTFQVLDGDESEDVMISVGYEYKGDTIIKGGEEFSVRVGAYGKIDKLLETGNVAIEMKA